MQVEPNVAAYTALMDACLKKGTPAALDEAFEVGVFPEACLLLGSCRSCLGQQTCHRCGSVTAV